MNKIKLRQSLLLLAFAAIAATYVAARYQTTEECLDAGFSVFYCSVR